MKKKVLRKLAAAMLAMVMCLSGFGSLSAFASEAQSADALTTDDAVMSPLFVVLVSYANNLTLGTLGKLTCEGETVVQYGYVAGLKIELQQYNGGWSTIKTWSASDDTVVSLYKTWYVTSGYSYRLKLTHTAKTTGGTVVDSCTSYSRTVVYN